MVYDGNGNEVVSDMGIRDSGKRSTFSTGAQRDIQEGKGRMDLLPVRALMQVAKIYEEGAKKYEARNWEKGIPLSRFVDSGLRHVFKWLRGDADEPHLAQACWNFLCLLDTIERMKGGLLPLDLCDIPRCPDLIEYIREKQGNDNWKNCEPGCNCLCCEDSNCEKCFK